MKFAKHLSEGLDSGNENKSRWLIYYYFRANVKNFRLNRGFGFNSYLCILFLYIVVFMHHVKFSNGIVRKGIQGMDFMK